MRNVENMLEGNYKPSYANQAKYPRNQRQYGTPYYERKDEEKPKIAPDSGEWT